MNKLLSLSFLLMTTALWAGISFEKPAPDLNNPTSAHDVSRVNAQIKVEGAAFRRFNLYLGKELNVANSLPIFDDIQKIILRDLDIVGSFSLIGQGKNGLSEELLKQQGVEGRAVFSVTQNKDSITASITLKNLITGTGSTKDFTEKIGDKRRLAHRLAQRIFEEFIGPETIFLLQIAAVRDDGPGKSQIVIMDFDGQNERVITDSAWLKSAPSFAPDGKSILYSVNVPSGQSIVEQQLTSKQFQFRISKPGLNIDARVLPDDSGMVAALSFENNNVNIFRASRLGTVIEPLTKGLHPSYSPSISSDGKEMAFVSHRQGTPQIYVMPLGKKSDKDLSERISNEGNNNTTPHFSPDGRMIAYTARDENASFAIVIYDRNKRRNIRVTSSLDGKCMEPWISPSGRFVIFVSARGGKPKADIFLSTLNGDHQYRLTQANETKMGAYTYPVIKPKP